MDESTIYKKVGIILKPLENQGIEIHKLQQVSDRMADSLWSAYNLGIKNTNNQTMHVVTNTVDEIYEILKKKSDEWLKLHP